MNETEHALVPGTEICPRHQGATTYLGQPCRCGYWACECGHIFDTKVREVREADMDETMERHLLSVGETLPSSDALYQTFEVMRKVENERRAVYIAEARRMSDRIRRQTLRENDGLIARFRKDRPDFPKTSS